jgi:catechol 2,3-dioxygenase-like lactoylglutathione lyase family enzyme
LSNPAELASLGLGPIDQVAYVVEDMARALPHYEALYGPFRVSDSPLFDVRCGDETIDCVLKIAVNDSGPIEVELIEPVEGDTPHAAHLREHGEGLHHVRFRVSGLEERLAALQAVGYQTTFYKRFEGAGNVAFAYAQSPAGHTIELLELG